MNWTQLSLLNKLILTCILLCSFSLSIYAQKKKALPAAPAPITSPEYIPINLDTPIFENTDYRHIQTIRTQALPGNGLVISYLGNDKKTRLIFLKANDIQSPSKLSSTTHKPLIILDDAIIHSFVLHDNYIVYLYSPITEKSQTALGYMMAPSLFIGKMTLEGRQVFAKPLVNDKDMEILWNRQFCHMNSANTTSDGTQIVWTGKFYSVIFPHYTHCDDKRNHQMDSWYLIDTLGNIKNLADLRGYANGWGWLTSHSFGQRLMYSPFESGNLFAVSANDAYPARAINVHTLNTEQILKLITPSTVGNVSSAVTGTQDAQPLIRVITPFDGLGEQLGKVFKDVKLDKIFQDIGTAFAKPLKDAGIFTNNADQDLEKALSTSSTQATIKTSAKPLASQSPISKPAQNQVKQPLSSSTKKDVIKNEKIKSAMVKTTTIIDSTDIKRQIQERNERRKSDTLLWEYAFNNAGKDLLIGNSLFPIRGNSGDNYIANTQLGDIIPIPSGAFLTFCSAEKRDTIGNFVQDVGILKINSQGRLQSAKWLTFTPNLSEQNAHTSRIGQSDLFLVTWDVFIPSSSGEPWERERTSRFSHSEYVIIDQDGLVIRPEATFDKHYSGEPLEIAHRRTRSYNIAQLSDGNVALVRASKNPKQLDLIRFLWK